MKWFTVLILFGCLLLGKAYASHGDPCVCNFHDTQPSFWVSTLCRTYVKPASCDDGPTPPANNSPVLNNISNRTNEVGDTVSFQASATDADGDSLSYSGSSFPSGVTLNSNGRTTGSPSTAGTFNASVTVLDGNGGSDSDSFTWTINATPNPDPDPDPDPDPNPTPDPDPPNCTCPFPAGSFYCNTLWTRPAECDGTPDPDPTPNNRNPVLSNLSNQTNDEGDAISINASASDADGDNLTFSATGLPTGVTINSAGRIRGTTTTAGSFSSRVTVRDGNGGSDFDSFTWNVNETSLPSCTIVCNDFQPSEPMATETRRCNDGTVDTDKVCGMPEMPVDDESVEGVDANANNVRDDVEVFLMTNVSNIAGRQMYADLSKRYQAILLAPTNNAVIMSAWTAIAREHACIMDMTVLGDDRGRDYLLPHILNNQARTRAYFQSRGRLTAEQLRTLLSTVIRGRYEIFTISTIDGGSFTGFAILLT